jgi:flavin reductase (DIM6/NTAB) family NADH-FMN oxidoreductase RutF
MTSFDSRAFRDALGWFATGVTIITARGKAGEPLGFTASSFSSVSLDPPLVLFSLNRRANSIDGFAESGHFAVNVLARHQQALSTRFASALGDRWDGVEWEDGVTGCPILKDALAVFDCATHAIHDGGDHAIFVGRVLALRVERHGEPLLYCRGAYRALGISLGVPVDPAAPRQVLRPDGTVAPFIGLEPWFSE